MENGWHGIAGPGIPSIHNRQAPRVDPATHLEPNGGIEPNIRRPRKCRADGKPFLQNPSGGGCCFGQRSEEHTSELQSLMRISYAVFCLKKKKPYNHINCT